MEPALDAEASECEEAYEAMRAYLHNQGPSLFGEDAESHCYACGKRCKVSMPATPLPGANGQTPISLDASGPTCTAFTVLGKRKGTADPTTRPYIIWSEQKQVQRESLRFIENSSDIPVDIVRDLMQPVMAHAAIGVDGTDKAYAIEEATEATGYDPDKPWDYCLFQARRSNDD